MMRIVTIFGPANGSSRNLFEKLGDSSIPSTMEKGGNEGCEKMDHSRDPQPIVVLVTDVYHNRLINDSTAVCRMRRINYLISLCSS